MTTYIDYIRILKSGIAINDYNHTPMLARLATVNHIKVFLVIPNVGRAYTEYSYEPPVVPVADAPAPPLAVMSKPDNLLPFETKVHLWRNYANGRKPSGGTFEVGRHYIVSKNGMQMECVDLLQAAYYKPFTVLRSQICTQDEYAAWLAERTVARERAA